MTNSVESGDTFMLTNNYQIVVGDIQNDEQGRTLVYASRCGSDQFDLILPLADFQQLVAYKKRV